MFSRAKSSTSSFRASSSSKLLLCADCSASKVEWVSVNLGVLLCSQCASLHIALGSRISMIRYINDDHNLEQIALAKALAAAGANAIWEYSLINSNSNMVNNNNELGLRKPLVNDPLHPIKSNFVRAKYVDRRFILQSSNSNKMNSTEAMDDVDDLSRQLHACVRTANLETSLRLLVQGADPNFYYVDKMSTPIQVAAKAGQVNQVELLLVYGADPTLVLHETKKASELASSEGHERLAERLIRSQYELSDRLSYFLLNRMPVHSSNSSQHFLVPSLEELGLEVMEEKKVARRRLQGLNNVVFEELAIDVYDETHRRLTDQIWRRVTTEIPSHTTTTTSSTSMTKQQQRQQQQQQYAMIPFLVVEPEYGTTRNQARQKLARLELSEFKSLVLDVLKEIKRRSNDGLRVNSLDSCTNSPMREVSNRAQTKSLPLSYHTNGIDQVEPIYDYVASDDDYAQIPDESTKSTSAATAKVTSATTRASSTVPTMALATIDRRVATSEELESLRVQLATSEQRVQRLFESNSDMRAEITRLASAVNRLCTENQELKASIVAKPSSKVVNNNVVSRPNLAHDETLNPMIVNAVVNNTSTNESPVRHLGSTSVMKRPLAGDNYGPSGIDRDRRLTPSSSSGSSSICSSEYPSQEEVVRRTEAITRCIQELLISAKDERLEAFIPCSERIVRAVGDMLLLFPKHNNSGSTNAQMSLVSQALNELTGAAANFESECRLLIVRSNEGHQQGFVTQQVIQCAFDIAKSTKQLVALFQ